MSHDCAALQCKTVIGDDKLMCAGHWRQVPQPLQQDINRFWRISREGRMSDRAVAIRNYRAAVNKAVAHVEKLSPLI